MSSYQGRFLFIFNLARYYALIVILLSQVTAAGKSDAAIGREGYSYGQSMPVACLNRTIDSGEHITDNLGKLQYIPFPTCNETFLPLALRYGITETINCTINSLPDELYHLLEYYVHSDVPLACRVLTSPLSPSPQPISKENAKNTDLNNGGPAYTPLTFALQGTLQRSHLHIWTDMNVLVHNIASATSPTKKRNRKPQKASPGYVVAGTAYSIPEFDGLLPQREKDAEDADADAHAAVAVAEAARDPWTAGHGTKVIRGEPLTFTFHVSWVEGGKGIWWPSGSRAAGEPSVVASFFSRVGFFVMAAAVGAVVALYWERNAARRGAWRGDGILGVSAPRGKGSVGISYGNGGKVNGYGGYSATGNGSLAAGGGGYGYTGFGKKD